MPRDFKRLEEADLQPLALGAALLGTGGGGNPYIGMLRTRELLRKGAQIEIMPLEALPEDAWVGEVGGIWVSPVEVESALISHPVVVECAVIGEVDDRGLMKPKAFVVLSEGHEPGDATTALLLAHCRESMADYKRPRWLVYVAELPKTATGKIQRFRLRQS